MEQKVPRLVLAGTNSGCGKTTVTCAVLQALVSRGLRVGAAKCGPDYIDPMFHSRVIGAKSSNLDPFFFDPDTMRYLLAHNSEECDVTVIEGVMGYYDGLGLTSTRASTYEAARSTDSPVVLVVNARGAALSVVAAVQGFLDFAPDNNVQGVILNGCSAMKGFTNATDAADYLVKHGMPFRDAHRVIGEMVLFCLDRNISLLDLTLEEFKNYSEIFDEDIYDAISLETCVDARLTKGAPGPARMKEAIAEYEKYLAE